MSYRIEEKLLINPQNLFEFKFFLNSKGANKIYKERIIESLYFDNLNKDTFQDSEEGILPRKKIRLRRYLNDNDKNFYYELKISSIEGRYKSRKIINPKEFSSSILKGIFDNQYGLCFPVMHIKYIREYFLLEDVRISIDTGIEYADYTTGRKINEDKIVAELKTNINKNLDDLAEDFPFQRVRFSKYCFGLKKLLDKN